MTELDMNSPVALYLGSDWDNAHDQGPRPFTSAAHAIRFAMEEAAPVSLRGALMVAGGHCLDGNAIARLYQSTRYPFVRKRFQRFRPSATARRIAA